MEGRVSASWETYHGFNGAATVRSRIDSADRTPAALAQALAYPGFNGAATVRSRIADSGHRRPQC